MIKLKVLERYNDLELDRYVDLREIIEVSPKRHKELTEKEKKIGRKFFEEVKETKEEDKKETKEDKKETEQKSKTRRKTTPSEK